MGFALDPNTVRELAAAIAAEMVQAMRAERIQAMVSDDREATSDRSPLILVARRPQWTAASLDLKPRELQLLALGRNAGRALNRAQLLELAWDDARLERIESDRTVDVRVRRLRLQLGETAAMLHTVARVGYRLDPP